MTRVALVTERADLDELEVPEDVPAVVVISEDGSKNIVLAVSLLEQVVAEWRKRSAQT